jgi:hypothetical protein
MIQSVEIFALGLAIAPDSLPAVVEGMRDLLDAPPQPRWQDYEMAAAWETNARGILQVAGLEKSTTKNPS